MYPIHLKFVIYGASGAGKSTLIELVRKISPNVTVHRKDTTRSPRETEDKEGTLDLRFVTQADFDEHRDDYDIVYQKYAHWYGVRRDQLIKAFKNKEIHYVIISDITAIQQLKYMYPDVIAIYIHVDPKEIPKHLQMREGVSQQERLKRIEQQYIEFIENNTLFDHIVLNFWDTNNALRQLQKIMHHYIRKATSNL